MPAFVTNGPDIPECLLQAHEDGRVVFFCGAGISYPAGLPDFRGLVDSLYTELNATQTPIENQTYKNEQYDTMLDQLERRHTGQRLAVRTALAKVLKPKWRREGAKTTHQALLQLASDHKGKTRLVTTNFDRIFQSIITQHKPKIPSFAAPLLPIPKPTRWHGVVHLHGLLPTSPDETALNRLVLTSGDFGLAYLTERWAARFVSELFQNYTVCFVGYGINDPVLRYMMDALAADELLGETRPEAYAFASFHDGEPEQARIEWQTKGATPLLYEVPVGTQDHSALHLTLKEWADTYRNGVHGKKMIVAKHANTPPLTPLRSDFAIGRMLWALTDGLAAKHFADLNSVPPLEWLEPLTEAQFNHDDLARFGIVPKSEKDNNLIFSFISRPAPYTRAPRMHIADKGGQISEWDEPMFQLARWLTRHLDDPKLILWLSKQGGQLHERFARMVWNRIKDLDQLAHDNKAELERIRAAAPKAIPGRLMRILWWLLLSGRVKSPRNNSDLYDWLRRFEQDGLTLNLRMELRELLTPCVILREPFHLDKEPADLHEPERIKDLVRWDLVLSSDHAHSTLRDQANKQGWQKKLPDLLQDFTVLLRDALDLMQELGGAEDKSDLSYIHQPSISEHTQNTGFSDWTMLIELTRDAWLATVQTNLAQAQHAAKGWWQVPYPLFKRLAFFTATQSDVITPPHALSWLLADDHWWLWSIETKREAIRLLVVLTSKLDAPEMAELEQAILQGPPREMFMDDLDPQKCARIVDQKIWLRLAKAHSAGAVLGHNASTKLDELTLKYPNLQLAEDERDEFTSWMIEGDEWREFVPTPPHSDELVEWLKEHAQDHLYEDEWSKRCRDDFPITSDALSVLAQEGEWPTERWREALQVWAEDSLIERTWHMAQVIFKAPDNVIQALSHSLGWWLRAQSKIFKDREELFFALIRRLLDLEYQNGVHEDDDLLFRANNHPVGLVIEALLRWWYHQEPKEAEGLRDEVKPLFTKLCDTGIEKFRHGRVLLAAHMIALFRVDEKWAKAYLLPLFDWQLSEVEARAAWKGFLLSPRLYRPLLSAIKHPLIETATYYGKLGKHAEQYAAFLTFAALDPGDTFTTKELAETTYKLPAEGLQSAAQAITRALEGAGEQRGEYWRNRVLPYLKSVWPKNRDVMTPAISEHLGQLCVAAREAFPEALEELRYWLQPVEHTFYIFHLLNEAKLCDQFPSDALVFLNAIIEDNTQLLPGELKQCLDAIEKADQTLAEDASFVRLSQVLERHGIS
ncbi:MAG: SIR2 family protein [Deltaproteobacteria bacterium]|jgi:AcrR family transcriptional regulator|nr:SIR2 family protein [Deltaproteobacteria bacterium]